MKDDGGEHCQGLPGQQEAESETAGYVLSPGDSSVVHVSPPVPQAPHMPLWTRIAGCGQVSCGASSAAAGAAWRFLRGFGAGGSSPPGGGVPPGRDASTAAVTIAPTGRPVPAACATSRSRSAAGGRNPIGGYLCWLGI